MPDQMRQDFDALAEQKYPWIEWRKPMPITISGGHRGLGCRLCIAREGFRPTHDTLFHSEDEFNAHMREKHDHLSEVRGDKSQSK